MPADTAPPTAASADGPPLRPQRLELLAPARDADIGIQAVQHGADAVYIGGPAFGARDKAGNSLADLERLARHAHRFNARIFVTLNTILRDDELEPARQMAWDVWRAGADALIVQDMGLLMLDLPPIQLHASTQTDIRTPAKARFLQDAGFAQMVLARELTLQQIREIAAVTPHATLEFFIHGALCVAYSGLCTISHALTGRSANRGSCSQECRQAYTVTDAQGRIVAHDQHVLSLKDNNQSANLGALIEAGVRSFKIEGRYKDMAYVKNVTAHYRQLLDAWMAEHPGWAATSDGSTRHHFTPDPDRSFNRGSTDYFVNGRQIDIGAFDTPKHAGLPLGHVLRVATRHVDVQCADATLDLHNGDALTWDDLQGTLQGVPVNVATLLQPAAQGQGAVYRVEPNLPPGTPLSTLKDLRTGTALRRNRDREWERTLERESAERWLPVWAEWQQQGPEAVLTLRDAAGVSGSARAPHAHTPARDDAAAGDKLVQQLARLGGTDYRLQGVAGADAAGFVPASLANALRRGAVAALDAARQAAWQPLPPARAIEPPAPYPEAALSYLANVLNHQAAAFYARHGVEVIEAAYESQERLDEVSLMVTRHCVRYSLSLCPKQAKGVVGVQGTVRAEPMQLKQGDHSWTLRFDCKACEMHVVGALQPHVRKMRQAEMRQAREERGVPMVFYRQRPAAAR